MMLTPVNLSSFNETTSPGRGLPATDCTEEDFCIAERMIATVSRCVDPYLVAETGHGIPHVVMRARLFQGTFGDQII